MKNRVEIFANPVMGMQEFLELVDEVSQAAKRVEFNSNSRKLVCWCNDCGKSVVLRLQQKFVVDPNVKDSIFIKKRRL